MTPRTEPMPMPVPDWLQEKVIERAKAEDGSLTYSWLDGPYQRAIARLLWEMGEPEPVDPDVKAVKRIIDAWHGYKQYSSVSTGEAFASALNPAEIVKGAKP